MNRNLRRPVLLWAISLIFAASAGCGKVGREAAEAVAKKLDDVPTKQTSEMEAMPGLSATDTGDFEFFKTYLGLRVSGSAVRTLAQADLPEEFVVVPMVAKLEGAIDKDGASYPVTLDLSISKECTWITDMKMTLFLPMEDQLLRLDSMIREEESLNGLTSRNKTYHEGALVLSVDSLSGEIFEQTMETSLVRRTAAGFDIEYLEPRKPTLKVDEDALFTVESEQYRLDMLANSAPSYAYKYVDASSEKGYSEEEAIVSKIKNNPLNTDLWHLETRSYDWINGERVLAMKGIEVINRNGVPVFWQLAIDEFEVQFWLQTLEISEPKICDR